MPHKINHLIAPLKLSLTSSDLSKEDYINKLRDNTLDWNTLESQEEYAVLDRAGRLQIPKELLEEMGVKDNKVKLEVKDGKIVIEKP